MGPCSCRARVGASEKLQVLPPLLVLPMCQLALAKWTIQEGDIRWELDRPVELGRFFFRLGTLNQLARAPRWSRSSSVWIPCGDTSL